MLQPLKNSAGRQLYWLRAIGAPDPINPRAVSNTIEPNPPNPGDGFEYIPIYKEDTQPDYDPRFVILTTAEAPNEAGDQIQITYATTDRPKEDVKAAIDNAKRLQVQTQLPIPDQTESVLIVIAAIARQAKGLQLTDDEQAALDNIVKVAAAVTANAAIATDLKAQVDAGHKPDIDAAWVAKA